MCFDSIAEGISRIGLAIIGFGVFIGGVLVVALAAASLGNALPDVIGTYNGIAENIAYAMLGKRK